MILSFDDARHLVESHAATLSPAGVETVSLADCLGRVLAEPVAADRDFPPFRRATRDGYAVRAADVAAVPAVLSLVAEIKAGASLADLAFALRPGETAAIMTGAPAPDGSDAVVMVEHTSRNGNQITVERTVKTGDNIVPTGAEGRRGDILLPPGTHIGPAAIGVAASAGCEQLRVFRRPRIAVLATGDEIVPLSAQPGPTQIRNSNSHSLAAQLALAGAGPVVLPVAPDELSALTELITQGLQTDLLVITGGVSAGKYDLVEQVLQKLGAEFLFTGTAIQPGKPTVFGKCPRPGPAEQGVYFFGLPGNPVSTMVTFELFARPMVEALAGLAPRKLIFTYARLKSDVRIRTGLKRFLPAMLSGEFDAAEVELVPWQGSGDIAATARANCYLVLAPDREHFPAGEWMPVLSR
jgi:molybdopterin molybdotransferase